MFQSQPSEFMRHRGNLSYPQFIRLVTKMWMDAHPDIPIVATGTKEFPKYPVITYRLDLRKTLPTEPKPRYREELETDTGQRIVIAGQRYQNVVTFTVFSQIDPEQAEEVVELFEDFMIEFIPVFKEVGISELVFARRNPDMHDTRPAEGVTERSVTYLVTTEKIIVTTVEKLNEVSVDARIWRENFADLNYPIGNGPIQQFVAVDNTNDGVYDAIAIQGDMLELKLYDVVVIAGSSLPLGLTAGPYYINNIIVRDSGKSYTISKRLPPDNVDILFGGAGSGFIARGNTIDVTIVDTYSQATPNVPV